MKPRRAFPADFNPGQFLAADQKKTQGPSLSTLDEFLPIGFSKPFKRRFLERLEKEAPEAFYLGPDRIKFERMMKTMKAEVTRELAAIGIAPNESLVQLLIVGIIGEPLWRRIRKKVSAPLT